VSSPRRPPERIALGLLIFLFIASVYRAWSLSVTMDEAYTYLSFVAPPLRQILTTYSANHHVLHSLLAKASVRMFGVSEFSLRIPSLIGCLICFAAITGLSRALFGAGWMMLLSLGLITLNPLIFDYMSQARGYSLALGFYLLGILYCVQFFFKAQLRRPVWLAAAGAALGLSLASNLAFWIPVAALNVLFVTAAATWTPELRWKAPAWLLLPEIITAGAITAGPLVHANHEAFVGFSSIFESLNNFAISCVVHDWDGNGWWSTSLNFSAWLYPAFRLILVITLGLAIFFCVRHVRDRTDFTPNGLCLYFFGGSLLLTVVLLMAAHWFVGAPYPYARVVLYCWPLLVFTTRLLMERFRSGTTLRKSLASLYLLFCAAMAIQSGMQFTVNHVGWMLYSAGTRQIADFIRERPTHPGQQVNITASASLYACLDFYRAMYAIREWNLAVYSGSAPGRDYLIFDMFDAPKGTPSGFRRVWRDPLSNAVICNKLLAIPEQRTH
jgi:4-amino-4-deoxy-L-arabinose transferase-like glycosyltransferase